MREVRLMMGSTSRLFFCVSRIDFFCSLKICLAISPSTDGTRLARRKIFEGDYGDDASCGSSASSSSGGKSAKCLYVRTSAGFCCSGITQRQTQQASLFKAEERQEAEAQEECAAETQGILSVLPPFLFIAKVVFGCYFREFNSSNHFTEVSLKGAPAFPNRGMLCCFRKLF